MADSCSRLPELFKAKAEIKTFFLRAPSRHLGATKLFPSRLTGQRWLHRLVSLEGFCSCDLQQLSNKHRGELQATAFRKFLFVCSSVVVLGTRIVWNSPTLIPQEIKDSTKKKKNDTFVIILQTYIIYVHPRIFRVEKKPMKQNETQDTEAISTSIEYLVLSVVIILANIGPSGERADFFCFCLCCSQAEGLNSFPSIA